MIDSRAQAALFWLWSKGFLVCLNPPTRHGCCAWVRSPIENIDRSYMGNDASSAIENAARHYGWEG